MTKSEFNQIVKNPFSMTNDQTFDLEDMVRDFPFFQVARALYLKGLKNQNSFRYNQTLQKTAIYATDRSVLFDFISSVNPEKTTDLTTENQTIETFEQTEVENQFNELQRPESEYFDELHVEENEELINLKLEEIFGINKNSKPDFVEVGVKEEAEIAAENLEESDLSLETLEIENEVLETEKFVDDIENHEVSEVENPNSEIENQVFSDLESPTDGVEESLEYETSITDEPQDQDEYDKIANAFIEKMESENFSQSDKTEIPSKEETPIEYSTQIDEPILDGNVESLEELKPTMNYDAFLSYNKNVNNKNEIAEPKKTSEPEEIVFELLPTEVFNQSIKETENLIESKDSNETLNKGPFEKNDALTFEDWLKMSSFKPVENKEETQKKITLEDKLDLIDEFIEKNPKIEPKKDILENPAKSNQDIDNEEIMTETLARVYVIQRKYSEAIRAYEILSLKFPEKSSFFATQIQHIDQLRNNTN